MWNYNDGSNEEGVIRIQNELNANEQKFLTLYDVVYWMLETWHFVVHLNRIFADTFSSIHFEDIHFICLFGVFYSFQIAWHSKKGLSYRRIWFQVI